MDRRSVNLAGRAKQSVMVAGTRNRLDLQLRLLTTVAIA
jgi:hypothetical protein